MPRPDLRYLVALIAVVPFWIVEFPPIQDLPNHLGRAHVIVDLLRGGAVFGGEYELTWLPLPNLGGDLFLVPLMFLVSAPVAGKIYLSAVVLLTAYAGFKFLKTAGAPEMGWLALPLLLNWFVHSGFLSFLLSVPVVLLALEYRMRRVNRWGTRERIVFGLWATAAWFAHLAAFGFLIAAVQLSKARRGRWHHVFRLEPGFLVGIAFWFWISTMETKGPGAIVYEGLLTKLLLYGNLFLGHRFAIDMVVFGVVVVGVAFAVRKLRREWVVPAAGCVALYLALPRAFLHGYYVDVRVLPFAAIFLLAALRARPRRAVAVGMALLVLSAVWTGICYHRVGTEFGRMVHAGDAVPRGARIVPLAERKIEGSLQVQHHLVTWLVSRRDVITPYLFAKPYQHPIRRLQNRPSPSEFWCQEEPEFQDKLDVADLAKTWKYVWIYCAHPVEAKLLAHGTLIAKESALRIYRLR